MQLNQYRIDVNIFFYFKIMKKNKDKKKTKENKNCSRTFIDMFVCKDYFETCQSLGLTNKAEIP